MFGIGTTEILVILVVALLVLGPKKLPEIAKSLGKTLAEFKRVSTDVKRTMDMEVEEEERKSRKTGVRKKGVQGPSSEKQQHEQEHQDQQATTEESSQTQASEEQYRPQESAEQSQTPPSEQAEDISSQEPEQKGEHRS